MRQKIFDICCLNGRRNMIWEKADYPVGHLLIIKWNKFICLLSPLLSPLTLPRGLFVRTVSLKGPSNRRWQPGLSPGRVRGRRLLSQFLPLGGIKKESMDSLAKYIYLLMHRQIGNDRPYGTGEDRNYTKSLYQDLGGLDTGFGP